MSDWKCTVIYVARPKQYNIIVCKVSWKNFILIYANAAGLRPLLDAANGRIEFLNAAVIVDATAEITQFMANAIDANCILFVEDILFQGVLSRSQIVQLLVYLTEETVMIDITCGVSTYSSQRPIIRTLSKHIFNLS